LIVVLQVLALAGSVALLATHQYPATIAIVLEWLVIALLSIDALRAHERGDQEQEEHRADQRPVHHRLQETTRDDAGERIIDGCHDKGDRCETLSGVPVSAG
jgi:hypothetical protein